jgi:hypothetical protein
VPVIPATPEIKIGGLWFEDSSDKKLVKPYLKNKPGMVVHAFNSSFLGDEGRRIEVSVLVRQKCRTLSEK